MNVLLYAPILTGHPQVYCRVIGDILLEEGHHVLIAAASDASTAWIDWNDFSPFADADHIHFVDTRIYSSAQEAHLTAEELVGLQKEHKVDSTLFIEGDWFREQFLRIAGGEAPRLAGRNVAICSLVNRWYPKEHERGGTPLPVFGPTIRLTLGRCKRAVLNYKESDRYFYHTVMRDKNVVDALVVKDERITEKYGPPIYWMPEIYRVFADASDNEKKADWQKFAQPIEAYIHKAGADNILLYFGTGTNYKGYDLFLKLADLDPSSFALHAGAPERHEPRGMGFVTSEIRDRLRNQQRIFETNAYVESTALVDLLFHSISRFVSTHRLTLSSGTMLQALEAGKPVLVPGAGLVGWRTEKFGLGETYRYLDEQDLARAWRAFRNNPVEKYHENIKRYMKRFSRESVRAFFLSQLCG